MGDFCDWATEVDTTEYTSAECCLAHIVGNSAAKSCDRLELRRPIMVKWAEYVTGGKPCVGAAALERCVQGLIMIRTVIVVALMIAPASAETLTCSTSFQGYRVCQGPGGFRSTEWEWQGMRLGEDSDGVS